MTTSPIGTVGASTAGSATTSPTNTIASTQSFDKDTFLKLLVAQLRYQDPSQPTDATQFLAETAQFSLVEKFDTLAANDQQVLQATQTQAATAMVGRQIAWSDSTGDHTDTVTSVTIKNGTPSLQVGDLQVGLDAVTEVKKTPTT